MIAELEGALGAGEVFLKFVFLCQNAFQIGNCFPSSLKLFGVPAFLCLFESRLGSIEFVLESLYDNSLVLRKVCFLEYGREDVQHSLISIALGL